MVAKFVVNLMPLGWHCHPFATEDDSCHSKGLTNYIIKKLSDQQKEKCGQVDYISVLKFLRIMKLGKTPHLAVV